MDDEVDPYATAGGNVVEDVLLGSELGAWAEPQSPITSYISDPGSWRRRACGDLRWRRSDQL